MNQKIVQSLRKGGIGVIPTDTLYGLVGSAFSQKAIDRIYRVKNRPKNLPLIVLISSIEELKKFGISLDKKNKDFCKKVWPGKLSIIFPQKAKKFSYLSSGSGGISFRIPKKDSVIKFLKKTGPLVAPSANITGNPHAKTIDQAKRIFKDKIDFYYGGRLSKSNKASTLVKLEKDKIFVKRQGEVKVRK